MVLNFAKRNEKGSILKTSPSWSYGGFMKFRVRVAESIGINLCEMEDFADRGKKWPENDSIELLLDHSDCEGELNPEECEKIAPRLEEIINSWGTSPEDYDTKQGLLLVAAMKECVAEKACLIFC